MSVNPVGSPINDPNDPKIQWVRCVDGQGNDLGWTKLVQVEMSPEEYQREMDYLANHPFYSQQVTRPAIIPFK